MFDLSLLGLLTPAVAVFVALLGVLIRYIDSQRTFKIKNIEALHNCLKEEHYFGRGYIIEQVLRSSYGVHVPYNWVGRILERKDCDEIFRRYKEGCKFIDVNVWNDEIKVKCLFYNSVTSKGSYPIVVISSFALYTILVTIGLISLVGCLWLIVKQPFDFEWLLDREIWFAILGGVGISSLITGFQQLNKPKAMKGAITFLKAFDDIPKTVEVDAGSNRVTTQSSEYSDSTETA